MARYYDILAYGWAGRIRGYVAGCCVQIQLRSRRYDEMTADPRAAFISKHAARIMDKWQRHGWTGDIAAWSDMSTLAAVLAAQAVERAVRAERKGLIDALKAWSGYHGGDHGQAIPIPWAAAMGEGGET
jgi:hypothetical protein